MQTESNYLYKELTELLKTDSSILTWLEAGSLDGLWYWDLEKPENEWLSPTFKKVFGYEIDEIPHTSSWWQENIFKEDLPLAIDNFEKHRKNPDHPYDQVVRYKHKTGKTVWVRCRGLIIRNSEGEPFRMLGAHTDITSLKEKELELEQSNQSLEHFAFMASHDFKEPLRKISAFSELFFSEYQDLVDENGKYYLSRITDAAKRLEILVESLLRLAKLSKYNLNRDNSNLKKIAASCSRNFPADLVLKIPEDLEVFVDILLVEQVFVNILRNCDKFRDQNRPLTIEVSTKIDPNDNRFIQVCIRDNGIGFGEGDVDSIFLPFHRLLPKGKYPGAGLGLSICQKIIVNHGGIIWAESNRSPGASICFTLPRSTYEEES